MIIKENLLRDSLRLVVWYPVRWLFVILPPEAGLFLLRRMGSVYGTIAKEKKNLLRQNMRSQLPELTDLEADAAIQEYFRNHFVKQLQIFFLPRIDSSNCDRIHHFEGLGLIESALEGGHGCILLHPHFGPTQMPLQILGVIGYDVTQIGFLDSEGLSFIGQHVAFRLRKVLESKIRGRIVQADSFLKPVFNCLRNNGVVMTAGDGVGGGKKFIGRYAQLQFLEGKYLFPLGAASLAAKTGAPILPTFTTFRNGRYCTITEQPIFVENTPESKERAIMYFRDCFTRHLREQPGLWHLWDEIEYKMGSIAEEPNT